MAQEALRKEDTAPLVSKLTTLLLKEREEAEGDPVAGGRPYMAQAGLLIDWLELLDPSVVSTCPELQQELVFGRRARSGFVSFRICLKLG